MKKSIIILMLLATNISISQSKWRWNIGVTPMMNGRFLKPVEKGLASDYWLQNRNKFYQPGGGCKVELDLERSLGKRLDVYSGVAIQFNNLKDGVYHYSPGPLMDDNGYYESRTVGLLYGYLPVGLEYGLMQRENWELTLRVGMSANFFLYGSGGYAHYPLNRLSLGFLSALQFEIPVGEGSRFLICLPEISSSVTSNYEEKSINQYHYYLGMRIGFSRPFKD